MKRNLFRTILVLFIFSAFQLPGFCTQLPEPVQKYIKDKFPKAKIRFDGYIELPDDTAYLPVLPIVYEKSNPTLEIVQTIPSGQDLFKEPDMILFNNNLALFKIIKKEGQPPTITNSPQIPLKVKLGLLPQDLVVPRGLVLSPELKVLLGDLKIPLFQKTDREDEIAFFGKTESGNKNIKNISNKNTINSSKLTELDFLSKKNIYTADFKDNKIYVLDSTSGRVVHPVNMSSQPYDMAMTPDNRYILMTIPAKNQVFVVDTVSNEFVKAIDVGQLPSNIIYCNDYKKMYVSNRLSSNISEIELANLQTTRSIPVTGSPDNIQISESGQVVFYNDQKTGRVFQLNPASGEIKELFHDKNISKIGSFDKYVLTLSRTEGTLTVFDLTKNEIIRKIKVGEKPIDFAITDKPAKILVLCADSDEISVIETTNFEVTKHIPLKSGGFPARIVLLKGKSRALITNYIAHQVVIYNTETDQVQGYIPVEHTGSLMLVGDK